ncbi:apolipoprotein N-acyltransferase [Saccharomonospora cyanea]|uniref:Apolipoprotein N-acyltransferase n=1 Tax=Saccharomonospora cyanea NA-134 TaxID=882082 RepID=H5XGT8_9PSEU|nr:apolipoprotein N-acyltransferase [Saccharomonospora cyanea]EHR61633.1 apolipoprotein N-acyltransferase [Saccharomonospora cyanea NA-134]
MLAAGSGLLFCAGFAPRPLWWVVPLAFAGLGLVLHGRRVWGAAGYGLVFGLAFYLAHIVWIQDFLGEEFGPAPWLALSGVLAAYVALACALMPIVSRLPGAPVWQALVFLLQESARLRWPFNGFPWGRVGFSQPEGAYLSLASLGGAPLVGFAVLVTGFGLAQLVVRVRAGGVRPSRAWAAPALAVLLPPLAGLATWPSVDTAQEAGTRTVAVVQGNAPDVGIGLLGQRDTIRANHFAESADLLDGIRSGEVPRPDLVVWPETATDVRGPDPQLQTLVDEFGVPVLVGALYQPPGSDLTENAALVWEPGAGITDHYVKRELVPFAEYVPMRDIARWFTPFVDDTRDMRWGGEGAALDVAGARIGAVICYEVAYDYVARDNVLAGAELLVAPTNNAWFGRGEMSYQQLAMSRVRAVEHGRAVVVAATSGVSAVVAPDGGVTRSTSLYTATSMVADVPLRQQTTLSDRLGAWTEYALVGAALAAVVAGFVLRSHPSGTTTRADATEGEQHGGGDTAQG